MYCIYLYAIDVPRTCDIATHWKKEAAVILVQCKYTRTFPCIFTWTMQGSSEYTVHGNVRVQYIYFEPESQRYIYGIVLPLSISGWKTRSCAASWEIEGWLFSKRQKYMFDKNKTAFLMFCSHFALDLASENRLWKTMFFQTLRLLV
jgi:hypothetical protein